MIENLEKWMYINDVKSENLIKIGKIIEKTKIEPIIFTRKAEVLYYFYLLIKGKIKLEDFFFFGDIVFKRKTYEYKVKNPVDALEYLKFNYKKNKLYILDSLFYDEDLSKKDNVYYV